MTLVWVSRDATSLDVSGVFANRQPGYADEQLDEAHPDVQKYYGPTTTANQRADALNLSALPHGLYKLLRSVLLVAVDEINLLRGRCRDQDAAVAAATSLADLKTRWAAVASADPLPDRTVQQAYNAVKAKVNSGVPD
jgi:hypothetical protein